MNALHLDHQTITTLLYAILIANLAFFTWYSKQQSSVKRRRSRVANVTARYIRRAE